MSYATWLGINLFLIEIFLIYNIVFQVNNIVIHLYICVCVIYIYIYIYIYKFYSIIVYYKI